MSEEYIGLQVPVRHYERMVTVLGELMAQEMGGGSTAFSANVPSTKDHLQQTPTGRIKASSWPSREWNSAEIAELRGIIDGRPVLAALIQLLLAKPNQAVFMTDFEKATDYNRNQLRSALAGLTQSIGKRFHRGNWPFKMTYNLNDSHEACYTMVPEIAAMWTKD